MFALRYAVLVTERKALDDSTVLLGACDMRLARFKSHPRCVVARHAAVRPIDVVDILLF